MFLLRFLRMSTNKEARKRFCYEFQRELPAYLRNHEDRGAGFIYPNPCVSVRMVFSRNFTTYASFFNINLWKVLDGYLHAAPVVVADIGCGRGDALREVKQTWGHYVQTLGFDFVRLPSHASLDRLVAGDFEKQALPEDLKGTAHLVVSNLAFRYFFDPLGEPLQKVRALLRPDGVAYIDLSDTGAKKVRFPSLRFNDVLEIRSGHSTQQ